MYASLPRQSPYTYVTSFEEKKCLFSLEKMSDVSSFLENEGEGAVKEGVRKPARTHVSVLHMSLPQLQ